MRVLLAVCALAATTAPSFARDVKPSDVPTETKIEIKARCEATWGDHADKYAMIAYCIDKEITAWAKVQNFN
ncbi:hypothetical protein ACDY96_16665 [Rhizobium mongolense]|uniref:hypothetical protein n=1 Tax=Rhizobium TaxID=379 RepID=UPI0024B0BFDF|nr:hypothetical protein [Rhizobium sp. CC1099]WFU88862.1 hypothetical protein QA644_07350 [Rhizobium sp. CC1099]